jgi:hypothetical protein
LKVEVSGITPHGIWLFLGDREVFLSFKDFPWFREVPVAAILAVERPHPHHLHWPILDIDLAVESIDHPEHYPLISRERPNTRMQRARAGSAARQAKTMKRRSPRR